MTTRTTLLRKEFYVPTETSPREDTPHGFAQTGTEARVCPVHYLTPTTKEEQAPLGFKSIDSVVADYEKDETRAHALRDARARVAQKYYAEDARPLTKLRLSAGLSQAKLGALIGSTQAHIARLEGGQDVVIDTLERIAKALSVDTITVIKAYLQQRNTKDKTGTND